MLFGTIYTRLRFSVLRIDQFHVVINLSFVVAVLILKNIDSIKHIKQ